MKKKGVNINIHLTNRVMYSLIALSLILIVGVGVYAFGGNNPSYVGHSAGELDGLGALATKDSVNWSEITDKPAGVEQNLNLVNPIYKTNSYCNAPNQFTLDSTCTTRICYDYDQFSDAYYECDGTCHSDVLINNEGLNIETCDNELLGYLVQE